MKKRVAANQLDLFGPAPAKPKAKASLPVNRNRGEVAPDGTFHRVQRLHDCRIYEEIRTPEERLLRRIIFGYPVYRDGKWEESQMKYVTEFDPSGQRIRDKAYDADNCPLHEIIYQAKEDTAPSPAEANNKALYDYGFKHITIWTHRKSNVNDRLEVQTDTLFEAVYYRDGKVDKILCNPRNLNPYDPFPRPETFGKMIIPKGWDDPKDTDRINASTEYTRKIKQAA